MKPAYEPVMTVDLIVGLILSAITFMVGRGVLDWTPENMSAFGEFLSYAVPFGFVVIGGLVTRQFTTALARPRMDKETPLMTYTEWKDLEGRPRD
jgi:hypothetical protein